MFVGPAALADGRGAMKKIPWRWSAMTFALCASAVGVAYAIEGDMGGPDDVREEWVNANLVREL